MVEVVERTVELYLEFEQRKADELLRQLKAAVYATIGERLGRDVEEEAAELGGGGEGESTPRRPGPAPRPDAPHRDPGRN